MKHGKSMDINCDIGEGFPFDNELLKYISSANICFGAHAGSSRIMETTIRAAKEAGVAAGAHPGYADRENFGRSDVGFGLEETVESVVEQMVLFNKAAREFKMEAAHMKLHGALYNKASINPELMFKIVTAVVSEVGEIPIFSLAGLDSIQAIKVAGGIPVEEAFADRGYNKDGTLMSRKFKGAVITDKRIVAERAYELASGKSTGNLPGMAETICIHGDTGGALELAIMIKNKLNMEGISIARKF